MTKIIPSEKAKQGRSGLHMLYVLIGALVLAAAVWYGVETYGKFIKPQATEQTTIPAN